MIKDLLSAERKNEIKNGTLDLESSEIGIGCKNYVSVKLIRILRLLLLSCPNCCIYDIVLLRNINYLCWKELFLVTAVGLIVDDENKNIDENEKNAINNYENGGMEGEINVVDNRKGNFRNNKKMKKLRLNNVDEFNRLKLKYDAMSKLKLISETESKLEFESELNSGEKNNNLDLESTETGEINPQKQQQKMKSVFLSGSVKIPEMNMVSETLFNPKKNIFSRLWWESKDSWKHVISFL